MFHTLPKHLNKKIPEWIHCGAESIQARAGRRDDAETLFAEYHGKIT